jgi:hypothetical protein
LVRFTHLVESEVAHKLEVGGVLPHARAVARAVRLFDGLVKVADGAAELAPFERDHTLVQVAPGQVAIELDRPFVVWLRLL